VHRAHRLLSESTLILCRFEAAQHAILARVADSYRLNDLHSTNGTQVNGVSITDAELKDGDKIRFGSVLAVFAGGCCKRTSKRGLRKFWTSIAV
jgi:pSer/pThr/pTyr-binding forkhead associated (FHA) protein